MTRAMLVAMLVMLMAAKASSEAPATRPATQPATQPAIETDAPTRGDEDAGREALQEEIEKLLAIERQFRAGDTTVAEAPAPAEIPAKNPRKPSTQPQVPANEPDVPAVDPKATEVASPWTRQKLAAVEQPVALADTLLRAGRWSDAARVYRVALDRDLSKETRAWVLYQAARCTQKSSPEAAMELYARLLQESPDCLWADTASAELRILEWQQLNRPDEVLRQAKEAATPPTPQRPTSPILSEKDDAPEDANHG